MPRQTSKKKPPTLTERAAKQMIRDCDSTVPDEWCIATGNCDCQLLLDLLGAASLPPPLRRP